MPSAPHTTANNNNNSPTPLSSHGRHGGTLSPSPISERHTTTTSTRTESSYVASHHTSSSSSSSSRNVSPRQHVVRMTQATSGVEATTSGSISSKAAPHATFTVTGRDRMITSSSSSPPAAAVPSGSSPTAGVSTRPVPHHTLNPAAKPFQLPAEPLSLQEQGQRGFVSGQPAAMGPHHTTNTNTNTVTGNTIAGGPLGSASAYTATWNANAHRFTASSTAIASPQSLQSQQQLTGGGGGGSVRNSHALHHTGNAVHGALTGSLMPSPHTASLHHYVDAAGYPMGLAVASGATAGVHEEPMGYAHTHPAAASASSPMMMMMMGGAGGTSAAVVPDAIYTHPSFLPGGHQLHSSSGLPPSSAYYEDHHELFAVPESHALAHNNLNVTPSLLPHPHPPAAATTAAGAAASVNPQGHTSALPNALEEAQMQAQLMEHIRTTYFRRSNGNGKNSNNNSTNVAGGSEEKDAMQGGAQALGQPWHLLVVFNLSPTTRNAQLAHLFFPMGASSALVLEPALLPPPLNVHPSLTMRKRAGLVFFPSRELALLGQEKLDAFVPNGQHHPLHVLYCGEPSISAGQQAHTAAAAVGSPPTPQEGDKAKTAKQTKKDNNNNASSGGGGVRSAGGNTKGTEEQTGTTTTTTNTNNNNNSKAQDTEATLAAIEAYFAERFRSSPAVFLVCVHNLSPSTDQATLFKIFYPMGAFNAELFPSLVPIAGKPRRSGVALFHSHGIAEEAAGKINDFVPHGQTRPLLARALPRPGTSSRDGAAKEPAVRGSPTVPPAGHTSGDGEEGEEEDDARKEGRTGAYTAAVSTPTRERTMVALLRRRMQAQSQVLPGLTQGGSRERSPSAPHYAHVMTSAAKPSALLCTPASAKGEPSPNDAGERQEQDHEGRGTKGGLALSLSSPYEEKEEEEEAENGEEGDERKKEAEDEGEGVMREATKAYLAAVEAALCAPQVVQQKLTEALYQLVSYVAGEEEVEEEKDKKDEGKQDDAQEEHTKEKVEEEEEGEKDRTKGTEPEADKKEDTTKKEEKEEEDLGDDGEKAKEGDAKDKAEEAAGKTPEEDKATAAETQTTTTTTASPAALPEVGAECEAVARALSSLIVRVLITKGHHAPAIATPLTSALLDLHDQLGLRRRSFNASRDNDPAAAEPTTRRGRRAVHVVRHIARAMMLLVADNAAPREARNVAAVFCAYAFQFLYLPGSPIGFAVMLLRAHREEWRRAKLFLEQAVDVPSTSEAEAQHRPWITLLASLEEMTTLWRRHNKSRAKRDPLLPEYESYMTEFYGPSAAAAASSSSAAGAAASCTTGGSARRTNYANAAGGVLGMRGANSNNNNNNANTAVGNAGLNVLYRPQLSSANLAFVASSRSSESSPLCEAVSPDESSSAAGFFATQWFNANNNNTNNANNMNYMMMMGGAGRGSPSPPSSVMGGGNTITSNVLGASPMHHHVTAPVWLTSAKRSPFTTSTNATNLASNAALVTPSARPTPRRVITRVSPANGPASQAQAQAQAQQGARSGSTPAALTSYPREGGHGANLGQTSPVAGLVGPHSGHELDAEKVNLTPSPAPGQTGTGLLLSLLQTKAAQPVMLSATPPPPPPSSQVSSQQQQQQQQQQTLQGVMHAFAPLHPSTHTVLTNTPMSEQTQGVSADVSLESGASPPQPSRNARTRPLPTSATLTTTVVMPSAAAAHTTNASPSANTNTITNSHTIMTNHNSNNSSMEEAALLGPPAPSTNESTVYVTKIASALTAGQLRRLLGHFGAVRKVRLYKDDKEGLFPPAPPLGLQAGAPRPSLTTTSSNSSGSGGGVFGLNEAGRVSLCYCFVEFTEAGAARGMVEYFRNVLHLPNAFDFLSASETGACYANASRAVSASGATVVLPSATQEEAQTFCTVRYGESELQMLRCIRASPARSPIHDDGPLDANVRLVTTTTTTSSSSPPPPPSSASATSNTAAQLYPSQPMAMATTHRVMCVVRPCRFGLWKPATTLLQYNAACQDVAALLATQPQPPQGQPGRMPPYAAPEHASAMTMMPRPRPTNAPLNTSLVPSAAASSSSLSPSMMRTTMMTMMGATAPPAATASTATNIMPTAPPLALGLTTSNTSTNTTANSINNTLMMMMMMNTPVPEPPRSGTTTTEDEENDVAEDDVTTSFNLFNTDDPFFGGAFGSEAEAMTSPVVAAQQQQQQQIQSQQQQQSLSLASSFPQQAQQRPQPQQQQQAVAAITNANHLMNAARERKKNAMLPVGAEAVPVGDELHGQYHHNNVLSSSAGHTGEGEKWGADHTHIRTEGNDDNDDAVVGGQRKVAARRQPYEVGAGDQLHENGSEGGEGEGGDDGAETTKSEEEEEANMLATMLRNAQLLRNTSQPPSQEVTQSLDANPLDWDTAHDALDCSDHDGH